VRSAIAALTNTILKLRNPAIWGCSTACASDGKYISFWDQNLVAEWNQHYQISLTLMAKAKWRFHFAGLSELSYAQDSNA
jgi:TnpA family transposase